MFSIPYFQNDPNTHSDWFLTRLWFRFFRYISIAQKIQVLLSNKNQNRDEVSWFLQFKLYCRDSKWYLWDCREKVHNDTFEGNCCVSFRKQKTYRAIIVWSYLSECATHKVCDHHLLHHEQHWLAAMAETHLNCNHKKSCREENTFSNWNASTSTCTSPL